MDNIKNKMLILWLLVLYLELVNCLYEQKHFNIKDINFRMEVCEEPRSSFKLYNFETVPENPRRGEDVTIRMNGVLDEDVKIGSEIVVNVKYKMINLLRKQLDLCDSLEKEEKLNLKCPLEKGEKQFEYTFEIPRGVPLGEYVVDLLLRNEDESMIFCSKLSINFE